MANVNGDNNDKTKARDDFIFVVSRLFVLQPIYCPVNKCVCVFLFVCVSPLFCNPCSSTRWIFNNYSPKAKRLFTNIHEPKANNCFSIITQMIIEIFKQKVDQKMFKILFFLSRVSEQLPTLIIW